MIQIEKVPTDIFILLKDNRQQTRLLRISDNKNFKWRKQVIPLKNISQYPFFTSFEVGNNKLTTIQWQFDQPDCLIQQQQQQANNKQIFQIEVAQKLQPQDIQKMKQQKRPQQIIQSLVGNNQQFNKRTQYSKQKYLKKKQRKYMFKIYAEPSTLVGVHSHYFKNDLKGICGIRWDAFALILLHGGPYKNVLMSEQGKGLLIAGVLQRGAKQITFVSNKVKNIKHYQIPQQLNLNKQKINQIKFIQWIQIQKVTQSFDNFLLLGHYDFQNILKHVQKYIKNGAPIVFWSQCLQQLQKCARYMKKVGYLNVKIQDIWSRQYQVLHNRTHPLMYMDSASGYVLSSIKVQLKNTVNIQTQ